MKVKALKCPDCGDLIYSRAGHDFHHCSCGNYFIDGGFDYTRCGGIDLERITFVEIEVNATKKELYDDWNHGRDKFGVIKGESNGM